MKQLLLLCLPATFVACAEFPAAYDVVWDSPSKDSLDSMPLSVRAREIRLHVFKAERPININEFQVFSAE